MYQICYKLNNPKVYNEGTQYERRFDTFGYRVTDNEEGAKRFVSEMNETATDRVYYYQYLTKEEFDKGTK